MKKMVGFIVAGSLSCSLSFNVAFAKATPQMVATYNEIIAAEEISPELLTRLVELQKEEQLILTDLFQANLTKINQSLSNAIKERKAIPQTPDSMRIANTLNNMVGVLAGLRLLQDGILFLDGTRPGKFNPLFEAHRMNRKQALAMLAIGTGSVAAGQTLLEGSVEYTLTDDQLEQLKSEAEKMQMTLDLLQSNIRMQIRLEKAGLN